MKRSRRSYSVGFVMPTTTSLHCKRISILLPTLDPSEELTETAPVNQHPLPSCPLRDLENVDVAAGLGTPMVKLNRFSLFDLTTRSGVSNLAQGSTKASHFV